MWFVDIIAPPDQYRITVSGCQVGGHVQKGGKEDILTGKGGQKEDIFY